MSKKNHKIMRVSLSQKIMQRNIWKGL